jgi:hypothetical protein
MSKIIPQLVPINLIQISSISSILENHLLDKQNELPSEFVGNTLINNGEALAKELFLVVQKYVEQGSPIIVRFVKNVDRSVSPEEAVKASGIKFSNNYPNGVAQMPRGVGSDVEVIFFQIDNGQHFLKNETVLEEYEARGLDPVDPYTLIEINKENPAFLSKYKNTTQWKDINGLFWKIEFHLFFTDPHIFICPMDEESRKEMWFAGVRKIVLKS